MKALFVELPAFERYRQEYLSDEAYRGLQNEMLKAPEAGDVITGIPADTEDQITFHAGTKLQDGKLVTSGGRVLCVVGLADTVRGAQQKAYEAISHIKFDGMQYRQDIGYRAIK